MVRPSGGAFLSETPCTALADLAEYLGQFWSWMTNGKDLQNATRICLRQRQNRPPAPEPPAEPTGKASHSGRESYS